MVHVFLENSVATSNFLSSSDNFLSLTVCASSTMWVRLDACMSTVLKKFTVILETDRAVSTALECAYTTKGIIHLDLTKI